MTKTHEGKSPLLFRYPGGKHYAMGILRPFWEQVEHSEYREPFVGGGSVFFNKQLVDVNLLNDMDHELITTYKVISDMRSRKKLIEMLSQEIATPERWREVLDSKAKSALEIAFKYYYLNRTSFSGKLVSAAWGYREKRSLPPERWSERIEPCGKKLEDVAFSSSDFQEIIELPSKRPTLLYVDPPYFLPPKHKHYRHGFDLSDHVRLGEVLARTPHKFFLTYDDSPEIRKMYKWANIYPVSFFYRVEDASAVGGVRRQGFELVISNYDVSVAVQS